MNNYEKSLKALDKYFAKQNDINYCARLTGDRAGYLTQVLSTSFEEILGERSYFVAYLLSEDSEAFMIEVYPQICCRGEGRARMTEYIARLNSKVWNVNFRLGGDSSVRASITQSIHENPISEDSIEYLYARLFSVLYVNLRNLETLSHGGLIDPDKNDEDIICKLAEIEKRKREEFLEHIGMRVPKEIRDINRSLFGANNDDDDDDDDDEDEVIADPFERLRRRRRPAPDDIDETIDFVFNALGDEETDDDEEADDDDDELLELVGLIPTDDMSLFESVDDGDDDEDDDEDDDDFFDDDDDGDILEKLRAVRMKLLEELAQLDAPVRNIGSLRPETGRTPPDDEIMEIDLDDPDADLPF